MDGKRKAKDKFEFEVKAERGKKYLFRVRQSLEIFKTPPVSPTYLTSSHSVMHKASTILNLLSWKECLVSEMIFFYGDGTLTHGTTPNLEDQALQLFFWSFSQSLPSTVEPTGDQGPIWFSFQCRVIKAHKPPHHIKVQH